MADNGTTTAVEDSYHTVKWLIIGLVVGCTLLLVLLYTCSLVACTVVCGKKIRAKKRQQRKQNDDRMRILGSSGEIDPMEMEMGSTSLFKGENFAHNPAFLREELAAQKEDKIEFPKSNVCILRELGETTFGPISVGEATGLNDDELSTTVLIKLLRLGASKRLAEDFDSELSWASSFNHPNILQLLGVCIRDEPKYLIYEYLEYGSLKRFLQSTATTMSELTTAIETTLEGTDQTGSLPQCHPILDNQSLLSFSIQIASAAGYMNEKGLVHQDLATRNVHVGKNLTVKVASFGFSRDTRSQDYYHMTEIRDKLLPVRWLAPETLKEGIYSPETDVWGFGVTMWEIFSCAQMPHRDLSNPEVIQKILKARPLSRPTNCPESIYRIMLACWLKEPQTRPNFSVLESQLKTVSEYAKQPRGRGWTWKMKLRRQQKSKLNPRTFNTQLQPSTPELF